MNRVFSVCCLGVCLTFLLLACETEKPPAPLATSTQIVIATTTQVRTVTSIPPPTETQILTNTPIPSQTQTATEPSPTPVPTKGKTIVVNNTVDSGPGTLRQAMIDAGSGDTITFDPTTFMPEKPVSIFLNNGLPPIHQGHITIDASNAGVILDGGNIGTTPETLLLDDISLTLDGGPNLIANGDFSEGLTHWRSWDEAPGVIREVITSDYHSAPAGFSWTSIAHAGDSFIVFDPNSISDPFDYFPQNWIYGADSTVWIPAEEGSAVELRFWYRSGPVIARLHTLFPDGRLEHSGEWSFDRQPDWTEAAANLVLPEDAIGMALEMGFGHSERWTRGLSLSSSGNTIKGLQIVGFPGPGIELFGGAQNDTIGGDQATGAGPLGQGNLISGNGNRGIILSDAHSNTIVGNRIGTDLNGTAAWGNRWEGIHMANSISNQVTGNLISGNNWYGIDLCCNSNNNTFSGNIIGADVHGTAPLANEGGGFALHDGPSGNLIGPDNVIAFNALSGIDIGTAAIHNTITQNSIHNNTGNGIYLYDDGNRLLDSPFLSYLDLNTGIVPGLSCNNCIIEIFSDGGNQGAIYEGQTLADESGEFLFIKKDALVGPYLTATTTDADGNTSSFSPQKLGIGTSPFQSGNDKPISPLRISEPDKLESNRIGLDMGSWGIGTLRWVAEQNNADLYSSLLTFIRSLDVRWVRTGFWSPDPLAWQEVLRKPGIHYIPQDVDDFVTELASEGINIVLTLNVGAGLNGREVGCDGGPGWGILGDKEPDGWFETQEERDKYIDYARFMAQHFKGRIQYYEIWNEPNDDKEITWGCYGGVSLDDYVTLVQQVSPVIHKIDPDAKIVVGSNLFDEYDREWLLAMLESGLASVADAISWHPFYGESPALPSDECYRDPLYWEEYPSNVEYVIRQANKMGFQGTYMVVEMVWRTPTDFVPQECPFYTDIQAAKYAARANIIHLGMDFEMVSNQMGTPDASRFLPRYLAIKNLSNVMTRVEPSNLPFEIHSEATKIKSYTFSTSNGDYLISFWTDGGAVDEDPGIPATLTIPNLYFEKVMGVDVLHGFEQELITSTEDGNLVIRDLLVKDYPLILRLSE